MRGDVRRPVAQHAADQRLVEGRAGDQRRLRAERRECGCARSAARRRGRVHHRREAQAPAAAA